VHELTYRTILGEDAKIKDLYALPRALTIYASMDRDQIILGQPHRCVMYMMSKLVDREEQATPKPGNFQWQTDDELEAYRFMFMAFLRDIEVEFKAREDFKTKVSDEVAGLTGTSGTDTAPDGEKKDGK